MITLFNKQTNQAIGEISEGELQFLIDELEEETRHDRDYYLDASTVDYLVTRSANAHLIAMLRGALGNAEGIDIRWEDNDSSEGD